MDDHLVTKMDVDAVGARMVIEEIANTWTLCHPSRCLGRLDCLLGLSFLYNCKIERT